MARYQPYVGVALGSWDGEERWQGVSECISLPQHEGGRQAWYDLDEP